MTSKGHNTSRTFYLICLVFLVALCLYSYCHPGVLEPTAAMELGPEAIGREVQVGFRGRVTAVNNDGFDIDQQGEPFRVLTEEAGAEVGNLISLRGSWLGDRTIKAERWHATKHRSWRVWVSIPPMILAFWLLHRTFRWNWRQWQLEAKSESGNWKLEQPFRQSNLATDGARIEHGSS